MTPQMKHWWKHALGLSAGPVPSLPYTRPVRGRRRSDSLSRRARRWWKDVTRKLRPAPMPKKKRRKVKQQAPARLDPRLLSSPVAQTFLAGASIREATHRHQHSDPVLVAAGDWTAKVQMAEAVIRAHMLLLAEEIERLRAQHTEGRADEE